jgi:broad specificity phosphatase PhoE
VRAVSRLILVRHAEVIQDPGSPVEFWQLSFDGSTAAADLATHPALASTDCIWSSPEPKALATAEGLAAGREVRVHPDLRELDRRAVGWVGDRAAYVALVEEILGLPEASVRGCERARGAERRFAAAVDGILAGAPGADVAVVSHGLVLTLYLSRLLQLPRPSLEIWRSIRFPDVCVVDPDARELVVPFGSGLTGSL